MTAQEFLDLPNNTLVTFGDNPQQWRKIHTFVTLDCAFVKVVPLGEYGKTIKVPMKKAAKINRVQEQVNA